MENQGLDELGCSSDDAEWVPRSNKRKGLVIKATNTTLRRIIVILEFYYVILSVSACFLTDLKSCHDTWPSKITARLSSEIRVLLSRSHVLRLFPKKKKN